MLGFMCQVPGVPFPLQRADRGTEVHSLHPKYWVAVSGLFWAQGEEREAPSCSPCLVPVQAAVNAWLRVGVGMLIPQGFNLRNCQLFGDAGKAIQEVTAIHLDALKATQGAVLAHCSAW